MGLRTVFQNRVRILNDAPAKPTAPYVLYWMQMYRRLEYNHALEYAVERANELQKPLLIFEGLNCDYPWASDRHHRFILDGMKEHQDAASKKDLNYFGYVEVSPGGGRGLLRWLAKDAVMVISDDYPAFVSRTHNEQTAQRVTVPYVVVDSNGIIPLSLSRKAPYSAYEFRRLMQKRFAESFLSVPKKDPLSALRNRERIVLHREVRKRWPEADLQDLPALLKKVRIDHSVPPCPISGSRVSALRQLRKFAAHGLLRYAEQRNHPDLNGTSGLSPYLHFGKISAHEVVMSVLKKQPAKWSLASLRYRNGSREGFWNGNPSIDAFLDQLITWREVGFHFCRHTPNYDQFESLPSWASIALAKHTKDWRSHLYSLEEFETGKTHDSLWNAAQRQLLREGTIHNYLRMLWGKKILEWTSDPKTALEIMIRLNDRYALDGRDPNSYSGIFWVLGRFDRPWGPERPVYGMVRYMSSENTARKVKVKEYLKRYLSLRIE